MCWEYRYKRPVKIIWAMIQRLVLAPDNSLLDVGQVRDSSATSIPLRNDCVCFIIPAEAILRVLAKGVKSFVRHVTELLLLVRHKARARSVQVAVAKFRSLVLLEVALDNSLFLSKALS